MIWLMRYLLLVPWLCGWTGLVLAATLETLPLSHRPAEELLPKVQALLEPGGAATGRDFSLFVRASPRNLEQIRELVRALDTPARNLLITLRIDGDAGKVGAGGTARSWSSPATPTREQRVRTQEGARAALASGQAMLLPWRQIRYGSAGQLLETTQVWREIGDGFNATARLQGDRVAIEIEPAIQRFDTDGAVRSLRLMTNVSGRLGEWIRLGDQDAVSELDRGTGYSAGRGREQRIWLRVDLVP